MNKDTCLNLHMLLLSGLDLQFFNLDLQTLPSISSGTLSTSRGTHKLAIKQYTKNREQTNLTSATKR